MKTLDIDEMLEFERLLWLLIFQAHPNECHWQDRNEYLKVIELYAKAFDRPDIFKSLFEVSL